MDEKLITTNCNGAIDALTLLVGASLDVAWLPDTFDARTMGLEALPAGLPFEVLLRRPDVLGAERALQSADGDIGAARAAFFPTISLTANIASASEQLSHLFQSGTGTWTLSPTISLPIFHGGEIVGNLSLANTNQKIALAQHKTARDSFLDVLVSQRSDYSAQQGLIATRLAEQSNRVNLYQTLGEGWWTQSHDRAQP